MAGAPEILIIRRQVKTPVVMKNVPLLIYFGLASRTCVISRRNTRVLRRYLVSRCVFVICVCGALVCLGCGWVCLWHWWCGVSTFCCRVFALLVEFLLVLLECRVEVFEYFRRPEQLQLTPGPDVLIRVHTQQSALIGTRHLLQRVTPKKRKQGEQQTHAVREGGSE